MDDRFDQLQQRILKIEERNARVEKDKKWETSAVRIFTVAVLTYFVAVLTFWILRNQDYWLTAFVPTIGFMLSVQSVPFVKKWWLHRLR